MKFPVLLVVVANCLWKALGLWAWFLERYWKTEVEAWISRHVELYYITTCLQQFQTAHEIQQEDTGGYAPFQPLRDWTPPLS